MKAVSPAFGKMAAIQQTLEGNYRACHTDVIHHAEEIAFYDGINWEATRVQENFDRLTKHTKLVM